MLEENPYRPPLPTENKAARGRIAAVFWWMIYLHAAITLALIYACWSITTVSLGRPPGFGEHPENALAHGALHTLDLPAMLLILGTPILIPIALWRGFTQPFADMRQGEPPAQKRVACLAVYLIILAIAFSISSYDPFRVRIGSWTRGCDEQGHEGGAVFSVNQSNLIRILVRNPNGAYI